MRSALLTLIVATAVIGLCSVAPTASAGEMPQMGGGWSPIKDVNDTHIQELGRWAVTEHVRLADDGLCFLDVVNGREQVYSGMNYELVIMAINGAAGKGAMFGAALHEQERSKKRQLLAFKPTHGEASGTSR